MYKTFLLFGFLPFAIVMMGLGYVMTPPSNGIQKIHEAKACKGFVVFNGERIPKCGDIPK